MNELKKQHDLVEKEMQKLEKMGGSVTGNLKQARDSAFTRFPILFVLISSYGLVATVYGFEKVIDGIDFFERHPLMILVSGILTLILTGSLYKKLN